MATDDKFTSRTLEPGEVLLGRYVVDRQVAEGGMAAIHRTHDNATGETVAVKVLYPYYSQNPVVCTRFLDEGRIQRYLEHPNIINVYDIVEMPQLAIVMEYIDGPTLDEYLTDHGPVSVQELLRLMLPVLSAVGFAHHKGVIHRDIKPSNILLEPTPSGMVPKIMDFGVAKVERGGKELTAAGTTVGTLHYMSPEQIVGSRDIDGRADIYSLGVTIYKLCTGDVPFNASTEFALMMAQVEARPTPPRALRPDIDPRLEEIILKALSKQPDQRYQTVKELTSALLDLEAGDTNLDQTATDTAPMPAELLEYAMMDDEIAVDRTGELDITQFEELIQQITETEKDLSPPIDSVDATVQLDSEVLKARILEDKASKSVSDEDLRSTTPHDRVERDDISPSGAQHVDSQEQTRPLSKPDAETLDNAASLPADTSSDRQSLSQETTQRFSAQNADADADPGSDADADSDADRGQLALGTEVDTQDVTTPRTVKDDEPVLRARASGHDSLTKRSRDDVEEEFARISKEENRELSGLQLAALVAVVLIIVALVIAIGWVLLATG
jgi:serine/threonine protein kinase